MSSHYNVITQEEDDLYNNIYDSGDDDILDYPPPVISGNATVATPKKKLVQITLFREVVASGRASATIPGSKKYIKVAGHYRRDGTYVQAHICCVSASTGSVSKRDRNRSARNIVVDASPEYIASRRLAARLHFEELMAMHDRNYPK